MMTNIELEGQSAVPWSLCPKLRLSSADGLLRAVCAACASPIIHQHGIEFEPIVPRPVTSTNA